MNHSAKGSERCPDGPMNPSSPAFWIQPSCWTTTASCFRLKVGKKYSLSMSIFFSLRIQVCPKKKGLTLHSYSKDGIGTLNPTLGRGSGFLGFVMFQTCSSHVQSLKTTTVYIDLLCFASGKIPRCLFFDVFCVSKSKRTQKNKRFFPQPFLSSSR